MPKLVLEKGESFDASTRKSRMKELMDREFSNLEEIANNLPGGCYIPNKQEVKINNLPYTIKEWPIYEMKDFSGGSPPGYTAIIARIKVID